MKYYLKLFSLPISLLVLFVSLFIVWNVFNLPPAEKLTQHINELFNYYGFIVILISAFIEGILFFGGYFPGVFIISISVISAHSLSEAILRIGIGATGLILAHLTNYFLGKYGWYKLLIKFGLRLSIEEAQNKLLKHGPTAIFSSYWLPSIGTLTDTSAGILHMPLKKFFPLSVLSTVFWSLLEGFIVYFVGEKILILVTSGGITELLIQLTIVVVWILILLVFDLRKKKNILLSETNK